MDSQENTDARRALGVRPGHRPGLKVETDSPLRPSGSGNRGGPVSPTFPLRAVSFGVHEREASSGSQTRTSPHASTSREGFKLLRRPTMARKLEASALTANRGQYETQKLLSHLLDRLEERPPPPDLLDRAAVDARISAGKVTGKGKSSVSHIGGAIATAAHIPGKSSKKPSVPDPAIVGTTLQRQINEGHGQWPSDETCELVEQVRDVLVLANNQQMDLFAPSSFSAPETAPPGHHRRGSLFSADGLVARARHSRLDSTSTMSGSSLLKRLAHTIISLLSISCVYPAKRFSLLRPPYALQALCLDIATMLYHKGERDMQLAIIETVAEGLYGVIDVQKEKICEWLEGRLNEQLLRLAHERDGKISPAVEWNNPFARPTDPLTDVPTFAFSADDTGPTSESFPAPKGDGWMQFSPINQTSAPPWSKDVSGILSTHDISGRTAKTTLQIAAIIPRILVALTSTIDLRSSNLTSIYRVHRLLSLILNAKPDAPLDLMEIVALGPKAAARGATDILTTFFPEVMGHNVIARRPALSTYMDHRAKWETGQERVLAEDDTEGHCWMPWKANNRRPPTCYSCRQQCTGFCVRCALCYDIKHVDCLRLYRDELMECHIMDTHTGQKRTSRMRFSKRMRRLDELVLGGGPTRGTVNSTTYKVGKHRLHLINLFTLTLCAECREPLWGAAGQGYACMGLCQQFFHPQCVQLLATRATTLGSHAGLCLPGFELHVDSSDPYDLDRFTISADVLKQSFKRVSGSLYLDPSSLDSLSYHELVLIYSQIWIQCSIVRNGVLSGSLKVMSDTSDDLDPIGLETVSAIYKQHLNSSNHKLPAAMENFLNCDGLGSHIEHDWLFQPRYLRYSSALLKTPNSAPAESTHPSDFLTVDGASGSFTFPEDVASTVSYEALSMITIRQILETDFQLIDDLATSIMLEQLRSLGLCSVPHHQTVNRDVVGDNKQLVAFPMPQLMDGSPTVELLVLLIERLLDDIDLMANEQGLRLLCTRAWPNSMCSPYALERLGGAVMSWVMAEDDVLHHIVKNYASKRKRPPGVRSVAKDTTAVANYKDDRSLLLMRYAHTWLEALHDLDAAAYAVCAYDRSKVIDDRWGVVELAKGDEAGPQAAGFALERLTTLADANVAFSTTLDLLVAWLDDVGGIAHDDVVYKSLPRLLRHSGDESGMKSNLWELASATSAQDVNGLQRVCQWLRVLACSGVEVPWPCLAEVLNAASMDNSSIEARSDLVTTIHVNATVIDSDQFAAMCNKLLADSVSTLISRRHVESRSMPSPDELDLLCSCMTTLLRAYGTLPEDITDTSLDTPIYRKHVSIHAKRKAHFHGRQDKVALSEGSVLAAAKLLQTADYPAEVTLDFLWLLFAKTPLAENADGFIYQVSPQLCEAFWPLYDQRVGRRSRARVFLKLLAINPVPVERMVAKRVETQRELARERLLTFILELADKQVTRDVTGWKRSATGLILQFFNTVLDASISDADNLVVWRALLPSHLISISSCFEDHLLFGSDEQRIFLLARLLQLHPLKPTWPLIGWDTIEQMVAEQVTTIQQLDTAATYQALAALSDAWTIRATTLSLGLHMLAAGIPCEWKVVQRFQQHVAAACALPWPTPADAITGILLPALKEVLDSRARITIRSSEDEHKKSGKTVLIGSQFVPVVIGFAAELSAWDFVVQRYILDILLVVFFKHNIRSVELGALKTLETLALYALECSVSQNAILALQVLRTAQNRISPDRFSRVLPELFVKVSDILCQTLDKKGDPALTESARAFLQESFQDFGKAGLVLQVLRVDGMQTERTRPENAVARALPSLGQSSNTWLDLLLSDLTEMHRWDRDRIGRALISLHRLMSIRTESVSQANSEAFGIFITRFGKQAAEWDSILDLDPNPLLRTCASFLSLSPPESEVSLLDHVATFLHTALTHFNVSVESLNSVVAVSTRISRDHQTWNTLLTGVLQLCGGELSESSISPMTLRSLLEFLSGRSDPDPPLALEADRATVTAVASAQCYRLLIDTPFAGDPEMTLRLRDAAAAVILRAEVASPGNVGSALKGLPLEAAVVQLNVLSHILYASVDMPLSHARNNLLTLYPIIARATSLCLFACTDMLAAADPNNDGAYFATMVFIVLRLSVLAVQDPVASDYATATPEALSSFWRRLWPDWDRLLTLAVAPTCVNMPLRAVIISVLEDIVTFIAKAAPSLLIEPAPTIARGLHTIEQYHGSSGMTPSRKLAKAMNALETVALRSSSTSTPGANATPADTSTFNRKAAARSVWNDMVVVERLLAATEQLRDESIRPKARSRASTHLNSFPTFT